MILYAATVFASAFLLFLIQPMLAKFLLPWFGGSPGVWNTCLLFFQVLLTAGYAYAHLLASRLHSRKQAAATLAFLALTILFLPITPSQRRLPLDIINPTWQILQLLFISVGACYFLLSSTGPLLQSWFNRTWPEVSPYRLYTLSNLGSLFAIVSYPFLIEPNLGLNLQTKIWSLIYFVFAVFWGACAFGLWKKPPLGMKPNFPAPPDGLPENSLPPKRTDRSLWLSLAALSSINLMSTTNQLCLDAAVVPLLWLLPMGLYLLSFILCFHSERWYSRLVFGIALPLALVQTLYVLERGVFIGLPLQIASYSVTLFICCMILHGELVRLKPSPAYLTSFYLMISAGGALGGILVTLVAPYIFKGYWEFHWGLALTAAAFLTVLFLDRRGRFGSGRPSWAWALFYLAFIGLAIGLGIQILKNLRGSVFLERNFFGVLRILEDQRNNAAQHRIVLMHGRIEHGYQFTAEDKRYWPTSYFGPNSGAGIAIRMHPRRLNPNTRSLRIGVVGLGAGTLAAYGEKGDYFRFYEINPAVLKISSQYFTYRRDSFAKVDVVLGDARISMERERNRNESGQFDVLAIDAFSSDAIPVHLLTRECYQDYLYHLRKGGILAVHISSRYFNLSPVIRSFAGLSPGLGMQALLIEDAGSPMQETDATRWILITANPDFLDNRDVRAATTPWTEEDAPLNFTDDYSNLFRLLR
jgi:hypothetical protein